MLNQAIKIKDLAAFVSISQFHFSRLFKQSTGKTPYQYIMEQRNKEDRAIADIALDCGFSSQSHLGKHFRQLTGITPKAYRQS
ncbi:MAG: helix-turn-helix transcriptional regulator [Cyanobacteria bacterium P01_A01_bin.83]